MKMFYLIVGLLVYYSSSCNGSSLLQRVNTCFKQSIQFKNWKKKLNEESFHLSYMDSTFELFNLLSQHDLKRIEYLENCVRVEDTSMFEPWINSSSAPIRDDFHLGRGNITHLTGLFKEALPDVYDRLISSAQKVIKELHWKDNIDSLGVRSVRVVSFDSGVKMKSKDELLQARLKHEADSKNFVIHPRVEAESVYDPHADENVIHAMKEESDSVYTMMIVLTTREKFFGGAILVHHLLAKDDEPAVYEDVYDDEEVEEDQISTDNSSSNSNNIDGEDVHGDKHQHHHKHKEPQYNALTSKIDRHTPDQGHVLLINSKYRHGVQDVYKGKRVALVLEFWKYADASGLDKNGQPSPHRATTLDAKPFVKQSKNTEL